MSHSDSNEDPVVMAEQIAQDGLKEDKSVGAHASTGPIAHNESTPAGPGLLKTDHTDNEQNERADGGEKPSSVDAAGSTETQASNEIGTDISDGVQMESAALADISGASDSDGMDVKDAKGHVRSGSVKKPTSFKSVSVTKNFLAKAATAQPVVRTGEKGLTTGPAPALVPVTAKPRLVAKSTLGGTGLRAGGTSKLNGASGPDANKVWNKNRPTAPAPPKHFTDEELQTRYGIHLATRLQSDEAGKDPKWADIDDDEDDWAPETVEWMDGTKSSVVAADSQITPPLLEESKPSPAVQPVDAPKQVIMQKPASAAPPKTILKPGTPTPGQPKSGSLVLKGAPEKPSLVAKPSAPTPAKSPWAPLPPVEKVPPVVINPPVHQQPPPSRFQRDPHGFDSLAQSAPSPAKEIAADDFSRSWRDDRGSKELYNSQSGRYEPVMDGGRRNSRQDHSYRQQPAVLQRPPHSQQQGGPAEPSSAFQTSRSTGGDPGSWARRRTSSNLSAGSGRRPSIVRLQDLPARSDGISPVSTVAVESPKQAFATVERPAPSQGNLTRTSSSAANEGEMVGDMAPPPPPTNAIVPFEENVARQQRLMREKIERAKLAKQREKEKEAEEVAARQERLKQKLAALEKSNPTPESKDTTKTSIAEIEKSPQHQKPSLVTSPPKPPMPTSEGEIAQYGMMKVHQPHPVRKVGMSDVSATNKQTPDTTDNRQPISPRKQVARPTSQGPPQIGAEKIPKRLPDPTSEKIPGASWKSSTTSSELPTWTNNTSMNAHSVPGANVWGPPSSNKALGNGTFETHHQFSHNTFDNRQNLNNRPPGMPMVHGPIAPPHQSAHKSLAVGQPVSPFNNSNITNRSSQNSLPSAPSNPSIPSTTQAHIPPTSNPMAPVKITSPTSAAFPRGAGALPVQGTTAAAWGSWIKTQPNREQQEAKSYVDRHAAQEQMNAQLHALGVEDESTTVKMKGEPDARWETRKRYANGKVVAIIELLYVNGKVHSENDHPPNHTFAPGYNPAKDHVDIWREAHAPAPLAAAPKSRYFSKDKEGVETPGSSARSESPPPPEGLAHPVFDGDATNPVVKLAPPKATVNLPSAPRVAPVVHAVAPTGKQDVLDKINNLFKNQRVTTVKSASKDALEVAPATAVISLPGTTAVVAVDQLEKIIGVDDAFATTKSTDDDLFEPPAFASKPTVRMSSIPHRNHQFGYQHELDYMMQWEKEVLDVATVAGEEDLFIKDQTLVHGYKIWIRVPGSTVASFIEANSPRSSKTRRTFPATKNNSYSSKNGNNSNNNNNNGSRKSSTQFSNAQQSPKPRNTGNWNSNNNTRTNNGGSWGTKRPSTGAQ